MEKEKRYQLDVTSKQLNIILQSVENMSRANMGQIQELFKDIWLYSNRLDYDSEKAITQVVKSTIFPELSNGASYGVGKPKNRLEQISMEQYELYRELRYRINQIDKEEDPNKERGYSVYDYEGLKYTDEPLPKLKLVKDV